MQRRAMSALGQLPTLLRPVVLVRLVPRADIIG
jgi:hypothetical protein